MTAKQIRDVPASVHSRLLRVARERGEELQRLLVRYALERFLYRLGRSQHSERFVLKGAMLFQVWEGGLQRTTRDLDLLGIGDNSDASVLGAFREIWRIDALEDGLELDPESLTVEPIREQSDYVGLRIRFRVRLGNAVIPLQVDVGVGDAVVPAAEEIHYPTLLDFPAPQIWAYPKVTVVAEKTQVMIELGLLNSRLKDYFDVSFLARTYPFDGKELREAIEATLGQRGTLVPQGHVDALGPEFAQDADKQTQWNAFLRRSDLPGEALSAVVEEVSNFVGPVLVALAAGDAFDRKWPAGGPWKR